MISALAGVVLALFQANVATTSPPLTGQEQALTIERPGWIQRPDPHIASEYYPYRAVAARLNGHVVLDCVAKANGRLTHCNVKEESPAGWRFGDAAILLAAWYQMKPQTDDGKPVAGAHVRFPVNFASPVKSGASYANDGNGLIVHPIWTSAPTFADVAAVYPPEAGGAAGHIVLRCRVVSVGALKSCSTVSEEPSGKGFARAAFDLVEHFQVSPESLPAKDSDPTNVDVPFQLIDPKSDEGRQRRIGAPTWRLALDPTKVAKVYPDAAAAKGITTGRGVAKCSVAVDGGLTNCREMPGEPDGLGFSQSAVVIASAMAMNPWTDEGAPVDGSTIVLPIRFNLAAGTPNAGTSPSK
jgi:TonB family protein